MSDRHQKSSRPFHRTRIDHASETAEDYVEAIADVIDQNGVCRGVDLARLFEVSQATVTKTIARLQREGFVAAEAYGPLGLTRKGRKLASWSRKRHTVVLEFLIALGVSPSVAETDAEGIEHHVSKETLAVFEQFIANQGN